MKNKTFRRYVVWYPRLCSQLVQVISVISLLPCQMWKLPVFLVHILLGCPPRLCSWSTTLRHVHHSSQYPHFLLFPKPSPLCRWHSTRPFPPSDSLRLQHRSPSECSKSYFLLPRRLQIFWRRTAPRLNFCSLVSVNNLPKSNSSLNTNHSARNLSFMFDKHLTFSDQISSVSKSCYYHIRPLCCILIPEQPPPSPLPLFSRSLTTAIVKNSISKIQDGGQPPFLKPLSGNISATVWLILKKFGTVMHVGHQRLT